MKAVELNPGIYWVGAVDWDLRNFHGYLTQRGSTYNAYLIVDDKITLVDTVKNYKSAEMLARISAGSLGRAILMCRGNFLDKRHQWLSRLINLPGLSREKGFEMAVECAEEAKKMDLHTSLEGEVGVLDMLTMWESWYRDLLIINAGDLTHLLMNVDFYDQLKNIAKYFKINNLIKSIFAIDQARRDLKRNRNTKLVMEHTVLGLRDLMRKKI